MNIIRYPERSEWAKIVERPHLDTTELNETVAAVLADVKRRGDDAVKGYELKFDHVDLPTLEVSEKEMEEAEKLVSADLKAAIQLAHYNIKTFHEAQHFKPKKVETQPGVVCWQKSVAIQKVGLYIPGGTAPLFSTVLMLATPAKIAGCEEIVLCTPPGRNGKVNPAAKQQVSLHAVAIDMPAGPSEVCVIADEQANVEFVAADLLSQAEHGVDSQVMLITTSEQLILDVQAEVNRQLDMLPRKEIAQKALENSRMVLVKDKQEAIDLSNAYAPEHLIIQTHDYEKLAAKVINAGSVFMGAYACESAGDYASGTNHTLPTHGYATTYSGVNLDSYCRKVTFQHLTEDGIRSIGHAVELMAEAEQLEAHKNAMTIRINSIK